MISITRDLAAIAALSAKFTAGPMGATLRHLTGFDTTGDDSVRQLQRHLSNHYEGTNDLREPANELVKLAFADNPLDGGTLVAAIVEAMQGPFGNSVLNGGVYRRLRDVLLTPDEVERVRTDVRAREMACNGCGKQFHDGESASLSNSGNGMALYCTTCHPPGFIACGTVGCSEGVPLPARAQKEFTGRHRCPSCIAGVPVGGPQDPAPPEEENQRAGPFTLAVEREEEDRPRWRPRRMNVPLGGGGAPTIQEDQNTLWRAMHDQAGRVVTGRRNDNG